MKAVVKLKKGKGNIKVSEIEEPNPGPGEAKIEIKACGICGSDIHIYHGRMPCVPPVVLGHEFSGLIVELGDKAKGFEVGDRVVSEPVGHVCGKCKLCRTGNYTLCPEWTPLGRKKNGAFTKYVVVKVKYLHKLPNNVDFTGGAFCEPLACAAHGVLEEGEVSAGDIAIVSGSGSIGLLSSQVLKASGCTVIICGLSQDKERLSLSRKLGVDYCINIDEEEPWGLVDKLTDGCGADVAFECAGSAASIDNCLKLVKKKGKIIQFGIFGKPITFDYEQIVYKELKLIGSWAYVKSTWDKVMKLLTDEKIDLKALVSEELPITEWREGFRMIEEKSAINVALYPVD